MLRLHKEHNILINHILLIHKYYLYKSSNSENLNFIVLKNNILKVKTHKEKIAGNDSRKKCYFIKNDRLSTVQ